MRAPTLCVLTMRRLITLADEGPTVGKALFAPLTVHDKGLLVCTQTHIVYAGRYDAAHIPAGVRTEDLGDVTVVPAFINAHTHIQLAHTAGSTRGGAGFSAWLESLILLLQKDTPPCTSYIEAIEKAVHSMVSAGTVHAADFTHSGSALVAHTAAKAGLDLTVCAEWFGFTEVFLGEDAHAHDFPPRLRAVQEDIPRAARLAPAGHALYSTQHSISQRARAYCAARDLPFALHLAESADEVQALTTGDGPLIALYRDSVLPPHWQAPGLPPVALADRWGLLSPHTLAVHGVHCTRTDADTLAATSTSLCLCPRSNAYIDVGTAPVAEYIRAGVLLCLGTDGLSSNTDMDVTGEAQWLVERDILPARAALRLLTRNGAAALHCTDHTGHTGLGGALAPGMRPAWAILPDTLANAL